MKKKENHFKNILIVLQELNTLYPSYGVGRHLSTALGDYGDLWGVSDKEILFAFTKYRAELEMDVPRETDEEELRKILEDGLNLTLSNEEDY